jgi:hypothetical protein
MLETVPRKNKECGGDFTDIVQNFNRPLTIDAGARDR